MRRSGSRSGWPGLSSRVLAYPPVPSPTSSGVDPWKEEYTYVPLYGDRQAYLNVTWDTVEVQLLAESSTASN